MTVRSATLVRQRLERDDELYLEQPVDPASGAPDLHKALQDQARAMLRAILVSERDSRLRVDRGKGRGWTRSAGEEVAGKVRVSPTILVMTSADQVTPHAASDCRHLPPRSLSPGRLNVRHPARDGLDGPGRPGARTGCPAPASALVRARPIFS